MKKLTEKQIKEDLRLYRLWLERDPEGKRIDWGGANLKGANLWGADLKGANLEGANLWGADLKGANLEGANLWGANLEGANLRGADLWGANMKGANLKGANLKGACLKGAFLEGANLEEANLDGANMRGANLRGANLDFASWPLYCGGTRAKLDAHLSLQLIYHTFNQDHQDPEIRAALEPLRPLAQRFINEYRLDATSLLEFDGKEDK